MKQATKTVLAPLCRRVMAREFYLLEKEVHALRGDVERWRTLAVESREELGRLIPMLTQWVEKWRAYLRQHGDGVPARMDALLRGMDAESGELARHLVMLYERLVPRLDQFRLARFDRDLVYAPSDLARMREIEEAQYRIPKSFRFPQDVFVEREAFYFDFGLRFLPESARQAIRGRDVIDGGAYVGDSALVFRGSGARSVYSFEPNRRNYRELAGTISLNGAEGVIVPVPMALGAERGRTQLHCFDPEAVELGASVASDVPSSVLPQSYGIDVVDLDSFVRERGLQPGLIKLDVEGAEYDTIHGAEATIREFSPVLIVSIYHDPRDFFEIRPLIDRIRPGYHFEIRRCGFVNPVTDVVLVGYPAALSEDVSKGRSQ